MVALGASMLDVKLAGIVAMSGLVGDPLLAFLNVLLVYGTYHNMAVQFAACTYGVITMAAVLLYAPFGYAATLLLVCAKIALCSPWSALVAQTRLFNEAELWHLLAAGDIQPGGELTDEHDDGL
mmetsp:Transcript_34190/g.98455  ORF Transcript_34190/g.98455 Transcript_34190/m.98455 type:complete len:124 (+) Transcript_34190:142-513(+)